MNSTVAIIQARLGSTRLPRKVLAKFGNQTLLERTLDRVQMADCFDRVIVATSISPKDAEIESHCKSIGVPCVRGSENDVLGRFVQAAEESQADWIVRVNADNPFIAPEYLVELVAEREANFFDYSSYLVGTKPAMLTACGFFAELVSQSCLERASKAISSAHLREHVTLGIYQSPGNFRVHFKEAPAFAADSRIRLTLDTPEDLCLLSKIASVVDRPAGVLAAEHLYQEILCHPEWLVEMQRINTAQPK